ncbi:UNVERIFIED_CONTAM: hypothetical protein GTU68_014249 [Idotea baltica]|nr:hypothetical protein [Idotea baltica]
MIKTEEVCKAVQTADGELHLLSDVSFTVASGESLAIVGPSGAGKSTLLGLLAGLDVPTSGKIWLGNYCITDLDEEKRAQTFQLLPSLTAEENVALPLELRGDGKAMELAHMYLDRVGLAERYHHYPLQLSGGEQQRVALARAFACQPKILFADEPTGNLDSKTGEKVSDLLFQLNEEEGTVLILVTHEQRLADRCGRKLVLEAGSIAVQ